MNILQKFSPSAQAAAALGGRLVRRRRGSSLRGGNSIVATGPADAGAVSIAAGATGTYTMEVVEDCFLDTLVVESETLVPLTVSDISIDNDGLINGEVPASMFANDSTNPPAFGHWVTKQSTISVTIRNNDATVASFVSVGFVAAPTYPAK